MTFFRFKTGIIAVALSTVTSAQAAYHMTTRSRPTLSLQRMMYPRMTMPSVFSRDVAQVIQDFDQIFDDMFYQPLAMQQRLMDSPSYFLPDIPEASFLSLHVPKQTYEIVQGDKETQIKVNLPGVDVGDINLQVDKENRMLTISGKTKREENGISMHSSFERSFTLPHDLDASHISAKFDHGVLHIAAPKIDMPKENIRRIDIVDIGSKDEGAREAAAPVAAKEHVKSQAEDAVIDLDVQQ